MSRKRVVIIDKVHPVIFELLEREGIEAIDASNLDDEQTLKVLTSADGLVLRSRLKIDAAFLEQHKNIKVIGRVGAGLEHIDLDVAQVIGVQILSSPEGNRQAVAEHALAMLLDLFNNIRQSDAEVRKGLWNRKPNEGVELSGKTIGIVGFGNTGSSLAGILSGFDVQILAYDKFKKGFQTERVKEVSMDEIFASADVVSLHIPYNQETHYLADTAWFRRFEKPIYLINTSRGAVVETSALLRALEKDQLKGACLDVLEYETELLKMPPLVELPEDARALMQRSDVVFTPHIAGLTAESYQRLSSVMAEKLINFFKSA